MARAYSIHDDSDLAAEPQPGQWHALRGELVALLDQVEGRYAQDQAPEPEPALTGLTQRVRNLRDQVVGPEPTMRRQEALRTVKRAVDRFSDRDEASVHGQQDALKHAIAEIRGRQLASTAPAPARPGGGWKLVSPAKIPARERGERPVDRVISCRRHPRCPW